MTRLLKKGDKFHLKRGHTVYMTIPSCFVYINHPLSTTPVESNVTVGDVLSRSKVNLERAVKAMSEALYSDTGLRLDRTELLRFVSDRVQSNLPNSFDTGDFEGVYTVTKIERSGGGSQLGMNGHPDIYPDGHRVYAKDNKGHHVSFYQTGSFTAMIRMENVEIV